MHHENVGLLANVRVPGGDLERSPRVGYAYLGRLAFAVDDATRIDESYRVTGEDVGNTKVAGRFVNAGTGRSKGAKVDNLDGSVLWLNAPIGAFDWPV